MADVTLPQMLKYENIIKLISRFQAPGTQLSRFYGIDLTAPGTERAIGGRTVGWDIFDNTRLLAEARAPEVGPSRVRPKAVGHVNATCVRLYESIHLVYERIFGTRPLGGPIDAMAVDRTGQNYVAKQIQFGTQRMMNALEFMTSRMFRGGFDIEIDGERHVLQESGSGNISVDFQIPSAQKGAEIGTLTGLAGNGALAWDNTSALIINQLLELNKISERQTGYPITEFWINSTTYGWLLDNDQLSSVGGSAYRVFDTQTGAEISTVDRNTRMSGLTVVFRAMPQYNFHIYDAVSSVDQLTDNDSTSTTTLYIPDGFCLATPAPDGMWLGKAAGAEPIQRNDEDEVEYIYGFNNWTKRTNDPPGTELRFLDNTLPVLYIPKAVYWLDVDY